MVIAEPVRALEPADRAALGSLLARVAAHDGRSPLADGPCLELADGTGFTGLAVPGAGGLAAYAHVSGPRDGGWELTVVVDPDHRAAGLADRLVAAALDVVGRSGGGTVHWWVFAAGGADDARAARLGFGRGRVLEQQRVALPLPLPEAPTWPAGTTVRTFVVGRDEEAWVALNNASFADHPEQGGWDVATLRRREAEPWFSPEGFLLAEDADGLAGACWTKLHQEADGTVGEIYVVGVHPSRAGQGLGRALTVAGLQSLHERGAGVGMLYVDAANEPAIRLYRGLGFRCVRRDTAYTRDVGPS